MPFSVNVCKSTEMASPTAPKEVHLNMAKTASVSFKITPTHQQNEKYLLREAEKMKKLEEHAMIINK